MCTLLLSYHSMRLIIVISYCEPYYCHIIVCALCASYYCYITVCTLLLLYHQSSKNSTSPMSETCKIWIGQVKFQDHKPDWACKIVESKLKKYWTKQTRIPFFKSINRGRYADPFNQRKKWVPVEHVEDVSGKLIISKFTNRQCFGKKKFGPL